jgi:23S rRNA (cytidine1920-2'-O)/16S rRNA (cytidine1409-2'-O)-methyltransferase
MTRRRLDAELVRRHLASSREQAQEAIAHGRVTVSGVVATKAATQVEDSAAIEVHTGDEPTYVSRGAHKLVGALDAFGFDVRGRLALDAGASTGGFTQVLVERGATQVIAVDVGYGQLAWPVRSQDSVLVMERTNVRHLTPLDLPFAPDLIVADLSFISLTVVLPALVGVAASGADLVVMVKPQFEVGKDKVGHGVVTDPNLRMQAVRAVADAALGLGLAVRGVAASPLPGPKGNVEYFLWMTKSSSDAGETTGDDGVMDGAGGSALEAEQLDRAIAAAVQEGPQ